LSGQSKPPERSPAEIRKRLTGCSAWRFSSFEKQHDKLLRQKREKCRSRNNNRNGYDNDRYGDIGQTENGNTDNGLRPKFLLRFLLRAQQIAGALEAPRLLVS
jgi:hypothetical protein